MGTTHFGSFLNFKRPNRQAANIVPYAGLPVGIQMDSQYFIHRSNMVTQSDLPANATNWTINGTVTPALSDDTFPPYTRITEGAATDNAVGSLQYTHTTGSGDYWYMGDGRIMYFETTIRIGDAGTTGATTDSSVTQAEFFCGFASVDTTTIAGNTDFIGFAKRDVTDDSSNLIRFVAGRNASTSGALVDGLTLSTGITLGVAADAALVGGAEQGSLVRLAFLYDAATTSCHVWAGKGGWPATANLGYIGRVINGSADPSNFPDDARLCLTYEIKNGEAVGKTIDIFNYIVAIER